MINKGMELKNYNTIIIESDPERIATIRNMLRAEGQKFNVTAIAETVEKAIKAIERDKPDMIIADIKLTDKNGQNLIERLGKWDFEIIILENGDFYKLISSEKQSAGFIMKKIDISNHIV